MVGRGDDAVVGRVTARVDYGLGFDGADEVRSSTRRGGGLQSATSGEKKFSSSFGGGGENAIVSGVSISFGRHGEFESVARGDAPSAVDLGESKNLAESRRHRIRK